MKYGRSGTMDVIESAPIGVWKCNSPPLSIQSQTNHPTNVQAVMQVHSEVKVSITTIISVFIECRFGGESYELESTWHPDLGPPFGVMFCVHCECVPVSTTVQQV